MAMAALTTLMCTVGQAQEYPAKAIRFIVPYAAGATHDTISRSVGNELSKIIGQSVVIENKVGADGIIGFDYVARQAPADGYTIAIAAVSGLATLSLTTKNLQFDPIKDLPPVVLLAEGKYVLAAPASLPQKNFKDLVTYIKANPGKMNYGSSNSTVRLLAEVMTRGLGLNVVHVPYRSASNYLIGIATNEVQMGFTSESSVKSMAGKGRALAVKGQQRSKDFPDAPTFTELGLPNIMGLSFSINVRAGTPKPVFDKLQAVVIRSMQAPEVKAQMMKMGLDPVAQPAEVALQRLTEEHKLFSGVVKQAGIQPE